MLTQSSTRITVLAVVLLAACALASPSVAPASSWGIIGTTHTLDSDNLGFATTNTTIPYTSAWTCPASQFHVTVRSAAALAITGATFKTCHTQTLELGARCTVTMTPSRFPWTVTGLGTNDIRIEGVHVTIRYENTPSVQCGPPYTNQSFTMTGSIGVASGQGTWDASTHQITVTNAMGLTAHTIDHTFLFPLTHTVRVMGTLRDTTQTLSLT